MDSKATATVNGGLFASNSQTTLTQYSRGAARRRAAVMLSTKSTRALRELGLTLDGVAPGQTAYAADARVTASSELGGQRAIESDVYVNRASTSQDVTDINADLFSLSGKTTFGASPVANLDGNPLGTR